MLVDLHISESATWIAAVVTWIAQFHDNSEFPVNEQAMQDVREMWDSVSLILSTAREGARPQSKNVR